VASQAILQRGEVAYGSGEVEMSVEAAWRLQRQWSVVATQASRSLERWRSVNLCLILLGSVLGACAAQAEWFGRTATVVLGASSAAALTVAGIVQGRMLTAARAAERVTARATSEALKGLVYQYLAAVPPFDTADRERRLSEQVASVESMAGDSLSLVVGVSPDSRPLPDVAGLADYVRERAEEQWRWHESKAVDHRELARRWRGAELVATVLAAALSALGGTLQLANLSTWVAVATTVAAALAAHLAGRQHDRIASSYARTVVELRLAIQDFQPTTATADAAAQFVAKVESVLAVQNDAWVSLFSARPAR
jgi:hypothetical protein